MAELITPLRFRESAGLDDWQVGPGAASIRYRTPDFAAGAAFIGEIATIADELDHHPDVDLRYASVTIRTTTHSEGGLTDRDVALAQRIAAAARAHEFAVETAEDRGPG